MINPTQGQIDEALVRLFFTDNTSWLIMRGLIGRLNDANRELAEYYRFHGMIDAQAEVIEMEINPPLVRARLDNDSWEKVHKGNDH